MCNYRVYYFAPQRFLPPSGLKRIEKGYRSRADFAGEETTLFHKQYVYSDGYGYVEMQGWIAFVYRGYIKKMNKKPPLKTAGVFVLQRL